MSDYSEKIKFNEVQKESAFCPACGNAPAGKKLKHNDWTFIRCLGCGSFVLHPRPKKTVLDQFYFNEYDYAGSRFSFSLSLEEAKTNCWAKFKSSQLLRSIKKHSPGKKHLDYGCGFGRFLIYSQQKLFSQGYEISKQARKVVLEKLKLPVTSDLEVLKTRAPFSVITSFHVFEHLSDPKQTLNIFNSLLQTGGIILIIVPNSDSWARKIMGDSWEWCSFPIHNYLYSAKGLKKLITNAGFKVVVQYSQFGDLPSPLKLKKIANSLFRRKIGYSNSLENTSIQHKKSYGVLRQILWKTITFFVYISLPLQGLLNKFVYWGDEIVIVAKKPLSG